MSGAAAIVIIVIILVIVVIVGYIYVRSKRNRRPFYRRSNRPSPRQDRVRYIADNVALVTDGCLAIIKSTAAWMRIYCPCSFNFTKQLTLKDAIERYQEVEPDDSSLFIKNLSENPYVHIVLSYLNEQLPKFYFKILPSGSLRERFGYKLPSTSILATDYDLMLVPDGIYVYDKDAEFDSNFPPAFIAIDDPNQNPTTPSGYLWLSLKEQELSQWKDICYERLMKNGVEFFLSQLAVLDMIKQEIGSDAFITFLHLVMTIGENREISMKAFRSGPAITIIATEPQGLLKEPKELFHADFTVALFCPVIPKCAQAFFTRRENVEEASDRQIHWPCTDTVKKIKKLGCHVVPKPSQKHLVTYTTEQSENSHLDQGAVLEWRYSFSQAEMVLSDEVPDEARVAFLAFKATIKTHVNNVIDQTNMTFREIPSYVLKTIFFYLLENTPEEFWKTEEAKTKAYEILMEDLYQCIEEKKCMHYWIPAINLLSEKDDDDFQFYIRRLDVIRHNYVDHLTSDWLEFHRCLRLHCCQCCINTPSSKGTLYNVEKVPWINRGLCCKCYDCDFMYDNDRWQFDINRKTFHIQYEKKSNYGPIDYNPELFEVY